MTPRTARERSGFAFLPRCPITKRVLPVDALERFRRSCRFDPTTGCVLWAGGTTSGRGNSAKYGSFWYEGRRWTAHRWAGVHIHGLDLNGVQAGHCCPCGPQTLCVEHIVAQTVAENMAEQIDRLGPPGLRQTQTATQRQFWLLVDRGYEPAPAVGEPDPPGVPFFTPPAWLASAAISESDACPF
jgi:hypothetical protein